MIRARALAIALLFALPACGGSAANPLPHAGLQAQTSVQIRIIVPALPKGAAATAQSKRFFVAANTAGILVNTYAASDTTHSTLLGQSATAIGSGTPACGGSSAAPRTCTFSVLAPPGSDTFVITSYDAAPVNGAFTGAHELASAAVTQSITAGSNNTLAVTLGGIIASLYVAVPNATVYGTVASSQTAVVEALDADGNAIVTDAFADANGSPQSVTLTIASNVGNVFSVSPATLAAPSLTGVTLTYNGRASTPVSATLNADAGSIHGSAAIATSGPSFASYNTTTAASGPSYLAQGGYSAQSPSLFFTESAVSKVASISTTGAVLEYSTPGLTQPTGIVGGPLGNPYLWVTDPGSNSIAAFNISGVFQGSQHPPSSNAGPFGIAVGPDGKLWVAEKNAGKILSSTTGFAMTEYATGFTGSAPRSITSGGDGALWFTDPGANMIGRITTAGSVSGTAVPTGSAGLGDIAPGADGRLWFTETTAGKIGAITTSATISEYTIPSPGSAPIGICQGPDGAMWFVESATHKIARITLAGVVSEFQIPTTSTLTGIAVGSDNNLWFAATSSSTIGSFSW